MSEFLFLPTYLACFFGYSSQERRKFMQIVKITKVFANGQILKYTRTIKDKICETLIKTKTPEEKERETKRQRSTKRYSRGLERAMAKEFSKFFTLTVPKGSPLRTNPKALIQLTRKYLRTQEVNYYAHLQTYRNNHGEYHIHGLSDGDIDLDKWIELTNAVSDDCYCKDIYSHQLCAARYIIRDVDNMPKGLQASAYNIKPTKTKKFIQVIDADTGEVLDDISPGDTFTKNNANHGKKVVFNPNNCAHHEHVKNNAYPEPKNHYVSNGCTHDYTINSNCYNGSCCFYTNNNHYLRYSSCPLSMASPLKDKLWQYLHCLFDIFLCCGLYLIPNICLFIAKYARALILQLIILVYIYYSMGEVGPYDANAPPFPSYLHLNNV